MKTAIILFNLGGPDSLDAVQPFLRNLFGDPQQHGFELPPIDTVRGHQGADERIGQRAPQRQFLTFWSHDMSLHLVAAMYRAHASAG